MTLAFSIRETATMLDHERTHRSTDMHQMMTVSEYVQRGGGEQHTHFHVDTTRSDPDEYVTNDMSKAVEALASFARRVTRETSFVQWPDETLVFVKHADDVMDYGRIVTCNDPSCECSTLDADSYLADDDPLADITSALDFDFSAVDALIERSLLD